MGTPDTYLFDNQPAHFQTPSSCHLPHWHLPTSHHVFWLAPPRFPRAQHIRPGTPHVEAGRSSRWPWCFLFANTLLLIHKALIWLLVATIAEVLPAVSD